MQWLLKNHRKIAMDKENLSDLIIKSKLLHSQNTINLCNENISKGAFLDKIGEQKALQPLPEKIKWTKLPHTQ